MASYPATCTPLLDASSDTFENRSRESIPRRLSVASVGEAYAESRVAALILAAQQSRRHSVQISNSVDDDFDFIHGLSSDYECSGNTSWVAAVFIMANCTIGMGLLNFPHAFASAGGIGPVIIVETIVLGLIITSLAMLGACVLRYGQASYQSVVGHYLGPWGAKFTKILIFVNNFGAAVVFLVVLGDQLDRLVWAISSDNSTCSLWYLDRRFLVFAVSVATILPLCFLRSLDAFKWTSFLGVLAAVYIAVGVAMTRFITGVPKSDRPLPQDGTVDGSVHLLKVIPIFCFSFECHIEVPPMVAGLKKQTMSYYMKMVVGYILVSASVYAIGGIFGYLTFGNDVPGDLLLGYHIHDPLVYAAMAVIVLKITATYPVLFFCIRLVMVDVWRQITPLQRYLPAHSMAARLIQVIPVFLITLSIAIVAPGITEVISVMGALSAIFIFIFPGLCFIQLMLERGDMKPHLRRLGIFAGSAIVTLGAFLFGSVLTISIMDFSAGKTSDTGRCG